MAYVWQLTVVELKASVLVTGTILKHKTRIDRKPSSIFANAWDVLTSYQNQAYKQQEIIIKTPNDRFSITTTTQGYFNDLLPLQSCSSLQIFDKEHHILHIDQVHPYYFKDSGADVEVISDIDDTVILSHTASVLKRIFTILFRRPKRRKKVLFSHALLDFFAQNNFRIAYLSKSESNLFGLITSIFRYNDIPEGPLFLSPYLKFKSLLKPQKGNHKLTFLHQLISNSPGKKFILIGDDTQKDMALYSDIVKHYSSQIIKVYIRQAGFFVDDSQKEQWQALQDSGVDSMYFEDDADIESELKALKQNLNLT